MEDNELKVMALKQRIGELVADYEEKVADLRVVITQQQEAFEAQNALDSDLEDASHEEVLEGEVV